MDLLLLTAIDPFSYQIIPDLGLMYLAGAARRAGFEAGIVDCRKEGWELRRLEEHLRRVRPRVVGIKCYSNEVKRVGRMAEAVRRAHPEALILAGGPHPSMDPEGALAAMSAVDYAFLGEAEQSLVEFMNWAGAGRPAPMPDQVQGIAWRGAQGVEVREAVFHQDLAGLPLPAWDLMPPPTYPDEAAGVFVPAFPAAPMMLSRGCPYGCAYCGGRYITGSRSRYRPVASVLEEIDLLEREYGVRTFTFVDDNFTWDRARAMELFEALAKRPRRIAFTFPNGVRADRLDAELLRLMERAGCALLALGIESGSDATLRRMKKAQTIAQVKAAVDLIRRTTAIRVTGFFILGYPGESLAEVRETIRFAVRLPIHHAHFCLFIPIPGTPVYQELKAQGFGAGRAWDPEDFTIDRSAPGLPGLPAPQLFRLHQYAYLRFYLQPWRVLDLLRQFKSRGQLGIIWRRFRKLFQ
jgi:radical SAM superfamily enzyme YgiQ (UPF0313 family)